MEYEYYEDVIDAYEAGIGVEEGDSLTDYIRKNNIKIINIEPFRPTESKADGGAIGIEVLFEPKRQNFFMGGPALEGQALSIYNSMKDYGATDQAIADRLGSMGLYDPNASTPDPTPDPGQSQGQGQSGGRGSDQDVGYVGRQDYSFNKKNYGPGEQLEINPAAFGMSFPDQPSGPKKEGIMGQIMDSFTLPTRTLSSFTSPTTGGNIVGPAEQGFMGQTLDIDPANRTREEIRSLYDNYNRFYGRQSNFADARVKGKGAEAIATGVGLLTQIPFLGKGVDKLTDIFGPRGDKSLQSKYTVDGVGFGNTGARDEFGLATFDKKDGFLGLTGNTKRDYTNRMKDKVGDLTSFFERTFKERGLGDFDINELDIDKMKDINSFYTKQLQAYKQRLAVEDINKRTRAAIEAEKQRQEAQRKAEEAAAAAALQQRMIDTGVTGSNYNQAANIAGGGGGNTATYGGQTAREATYDNDKSTGTSQGYSQHYARGGLATMFTRRR